MTIFIIGIIEWGCICLHEDGRLFFSSFMKFLYYISNNKALVYCYLFLLGFVRHEKNYEGYIYEVLGQDIVIVQRETHIDALGDMYPLHSQGWVMPWMLLVPRFTLSWVLVCVIFVSKKIIHESFPQFNWVRERWNVKKMKRMILCLLGLNKT
jgi:hypothetical protein